MDEWKKLTSIRGTSGALTKHRSESSTSKPILIELVKKKTKMEAVFYPNTDTLWYKMEPKPKWKSALVTALTCLLFLVTEGRVSWFIICTDGFHTLTEASYLTSFQTHIPSDFLFPRSAELPL